MAYDTSEMTADQERQWYEARNAQRAAFSEWIKTPEGKAAYEKDVVERWDDIQNHRNGYESESSWLDRFMDKNLSKFVEAIPIIYAAMLTAGAAGAFGGTAAAAGEGAAAGAAAAGAGAAEAGAGLAAAGAGAAELAGAGSLVGVAGGAMPVVTIPGVAAAGGISAGTVAAGVGAAGAALSSGGGVTEASAQGEPNQPASSPVNAETPTIPEATGETTVPSTTEPIGVAGEAPVTVNVGPPALDSANFGAGIGGLSFEEMLAAGGVLGTSALTAAGAGSTPTGQIISGGNQFGANAAGPGQTYDAYGNIIPNEAAASTQATQMADQTAANLANGLTAEGGLTPQQYAAAAAANGGTTAGLSNQEIIRLAQGAYNAVGSIFTGNQARENGENLAAASREAAGILAPAITKGAGIQADAATAAGNTLSTAAMQGAQMQADGTMKGANTIATGATDAAMTRSTADIAGGWIQSQAALGSGAMMSDITLANGQRMSGAAMDTAEMRARAYEEATGQRVAGFNAAIGTADQTLAKQTENQKPYMDAGTKALQQIMTGLQEGGQFNRQFTMKDARNMDAYKFALDQGSRAINNASSRGGLRLSSANIESLGAFAEGTAAQFQQQAFNQWMTQNNFTLAGLQNMVQTGQVSVNQLQSALAQHGISVETLQSAIGEAQAQGTLGAGMARADGAMSSAGYLSAADAAAGTYRANASTGSAGYLAGGLKDAATATAGGQLAAANALGSGQAVSAGQLAGGVTDAANAQAAAGVASAGYTAGGITGSAEVQANGITGAANSIAAGDTARTNSIAGGLNSLGTQVAGAAGTYLLNNGKSIASSAGDWLSSLFST